MEIMTTWDTDFEFDLQRFTAWTINKGAAPFSSTTKDSIYTTAGGWEEVDALAADRTDILAVYKAGAAVGTGTLYVLSGDTVNQNATTANQAATKVMVLKSGQSLLKTAGSITPVAAAGDVIVAGGTLTLGADSAVTYAAAAATIDGVTPGAKGITVKSGTVEFTDSVTSTDFTVANSAGIKTTKGTLTATASGTGVLNIAGGAFTAKSGSYTTTTTGGTAVAVDASGSNVVINDVTFVKGGAGSGGTYTYTGEAVALANSSSIKTTADSKITTLTTSGQAAYTYTIDDAVMTFTMGTSAASGAITEFSSGKVTLTAKNAAGDAVTINPGTTENNTIKVTDGVGAVIEGGSTLKVTGYETGSIVTGSALKALSVNTHSYSVSAATTFAYDGTNTRESIVAGTVTLSGASGIGTKTVYGAQTNGTAVSEVVADSGTFSVKFAAGAATVSDLANGEKVTITDAADNKNYATYEATASNVVKATISTAGTVEEKFYQLVDGANMTDAQLKVGGVEGKAVLTEVQANDIYVAKYDSETWFTTYGAAFSTNPGTYAAKLDVSGSGASATRTLTVTSDLSKDVYISGVQTKVVDNSTKDNTIYFVTNKDGVSKIHGAEFSVSSEGVISSVTGTITLLDGAADTIYLSGTVNVDTTAVTTGKAVNSTTPVVTYVAGASVDGAKVTLNSGSPLVLTESTNETDTVIYEGGSVKGLDAGGIVKNAVTGNVVTTAGSDTSANVYTINGVEWTVTGDAETRFAVNTDNATQLSAITNLDLDATVSTTKKFSQDTLVINGTDTVVGTTFYNVVSKDGLTFTSTKKDATASVTLNAAGESVTLTSATTGDVYTVVSTSDGVTIGSDGTITGLTNGDVVTVHKKDSADNQNIVTLTVSDGKLAITGYGATAGTPLAATTYTLDSGETEFTAKLGTAGTYTTTADATNGVKVSNGTAGEDVTGFSVGTGSDAFNDKVTVDSITNGVYLDRDGKTLTDNSSGKAVAQIQLENDRITYTEIGDKAQYVGVANTETNYEWNITTNGGKDTINYFGKQNATINSGAGNDFVNAGSDNDLHISLGAGKDTVSVSGKGDHTIVAGEGNSEITVTATGDVRVDATGAGNKQIYHTSASGVATLYGGDGNDTIKALSTDDSVVGGAGNNVFDVTTTGMKVSDYNVTKDVISIAGGASASTIMSASQFLGDGTVSLSATSDHVLDVSDGTGVSGYYAIAAEGTDGKKQFFGWAQDSGSTIDVSTVEESVILIGNNNDDKADTLMGGTKNDVIYAGEGDAVYGGAGKDLLVLDSTTGNQTVYTATTAGKDTVTGFTAGFEDGDTINFVDGAASDVTFAYANKTVTVKDGDGSLTMTGLDTVASGAVELFAANTKVALTGEKGIIKTDSVGYADVYVGDGSAVDFSSVEGGLHVNLANGIAGDANLARFSGITSVKGGTGATTLMGATSAESLVSGGGNTSLWGGAGKDTLVGGDGADVFFIGAGDGTDTMTKFTGGTDAASDALFVLSDITGAKLGSTGVEVTTTDAKAVLSGTNANTAIHFATSGAEGVAKVGSATSNNNFNYDSTVTHYVGGSKTDKIAFASGSTENAEIWMDGSRGKGYASIDVVDGTNTSGNLIVAGDSSSQSIIGGKGDTSLWGGAGSVSDTLRSSSTGKTMFWWGAGDGNDVVVSTSANDSVNLYSLKLSDVDVANSSITNSGVSLALNDGSKLTVQTSRDMTFSIDGQSWTAQHNSKEWKQNS